MGAELISAVLEIDHNVQPDWDKAENFIRNMDDLTVVNLYSDILELEEEYFQDELSDIPKEIESARNGFLDALDDCRLGWQNSHRFMNKIRLKNSTILLAAGETWGDSVHQCDSIMLFDGCGAAKKAGFY